MRLRWLCAAAAAAIVGMCPALAADAPSTSSSGDAAAPGRLLMEAAEASRKTDFEGVLVYRSGDAMEVLRVIHRFRHGQESEHLITLTGERRELIRHGNELTCILPRDRRLTLHRPAVKSLLGRLDGPVVDTLKRWYAFRALGTTRIAGQECMGVAVRPRDDYRYGYEVWTDTSNHLPLRVALLGPHRKVLEQVMFTEIHFPSSIPDSAFQSKIARAPGYKVLTRQLPRHGAADVPPLPQAGKGEDRSADDRWRFKRLPPGFHVVLRDQRDVPDGIGHVQHMLLSDGLSSVSAFIARAHPSEPSFEGLSHMGSVHAFGRNLDDFHITVVGEVPSRTVRMIGDALRFSPTPLAPAGAAHATSAPAAAASTAAP